MPDDVFELDMVEDDEPLVEPVEPDELLVRFEWSVRPSRMRNKSYFLKQAGVSLFKLMFTLVCLNLSNFFVK